MFKDSLIYLFIFVKINEQQKMLQKTFKTFQTHIFSSCVLNISMFLSCTVDSRFVTKPISIMILALILEFMIWDIDMLGYWHFFHISFEIFENFYVTNSQHIKRKVENSHYHVNIQIITLIKAIIRSLFHIQTCDEINFHTKFGKVFQDFK